jgi:ferredoxin
VTRERPLRLRVDFVACDGVGLCSHLAPAVVGLDRWGFPLVTDQHLPAELVHEARVAVRACPRRALFLERAPERQGRGTPAR